MTTQLLQPSAWAITDVYGHIQSVSREARELLGLGDVKGASLLDLFPQYCKALVFDIQVALTGWPTGRTIVVRSVAADAIAVRYRVSRRLASDGVQLFWQLHRDKSDDAPRCA